LEFWKRETAYLDMKWGEFVLKDPELPRFVKRKKEYLAKYDSVVIRYFMSRGKAFKTYISMIILLFMV